MYLQSDGRLIELEMAGYERVGRSRPGVLLLKCSDVKLTLDEFSKYN